MPVTPILVVTQTISGDLDTPVSAYLKLAPTPGFLFESVVGGESVARYSIIGCRPLVEYRAVSDGVHISSGRDSHFVAGNPIDVIQTDFDRYQPNESGGPFPNGLFGFFAWEIIGQIEKIQCREKPGLGIPLGEFFIPGTLVVFDHAKRVIVIVAMSIGDAAEAHAEIDRVLQRLNSPSHGIPRSVVPVAGDVFDHVTASMTPDQFKESVRRAGDHIRDGDVFQLVLSLRFQVESAKLPFDAYRDLRLINPSPYMFFFDFGSYQIVGSSPEILVKLTDGLATLRPIAGTRPRDPQKDPRREEALIEELLADEKEVAEHVMLVDLGRNDLGRVCQSVAVTEMMGIEKYSHVMHIVSHVEGRVREGTSAFALLKATFPAGTVSGAPKVRAVALIDEIEPTARGVYSGAVGYVDFGGNMDVCIAIRTAVAKDGIYYVQAGAGLVADSDPDTEYKECQNKARGVLTACVEGAARC